MCASVTPVPPAASGLLPNQVCDLSDDLPGFLVLGGGLRDDAVSIEWALGKDAVLVQDVVKGDRAVVALVEIDQDPPRRLENTPPLRIGIVDLVEPNVITTVSQRRGVAQYLERPFDGGSELPAPNESLIIPVDQFERALIEIETLGRAGKGNPEAFVQAANQSHVFRLFENELGRCRRREKTWVVLLLALVDSWPLSVILYIGFRGS